MFSPTEKCWLGEESELRARPGQMPEGTATGLQALRPVGPGAQQVLRKPPLCLRRASAF